MKESFDYGVKDIEIKKGVTAFLPWSHIKYWPHNGAIEHLRNAMSLDSARK